MPGLICCPNTGVASSEPSYQAGVNTLIVDDSFESYASSAALRSGYGGSRNDTFISLLTGTDGPNGTKAARWSYGQGFIDDILFGPDNFQSPSTNWGGYTEIYVKVWVRWSNGADPADANFNGLKGFMFWDANFSGARYEFASNRADNNTNALATRWLKVFNLSNAASGLNVWKTSDGWAPKQSDVADGTSWHRVTFHVRAGPSQTNKGAKIWLDGTLVYNDQGVDVVTGQPSGYEGYTYSVAVGGFQMYGNYIDAAHESTAFTLDVDRWQIWIP